MPDTNDTASIYQLTEEVRALIEELSSNAKALEQQAQGALRMLCKLRGFDGNWSYENGKLSRQEGANHRRDGCDGVRGRGWCGLHSAQRLRRGHHLHAGREVTSSGVVYISLQAANAGNTPASPPTWRQSLAGVACSIRERRAPSNARL